MQDIEGEIFLKSLLQDLQKIIDRYTKKLKK